MPYDVDLRTAPRSVLAALRDAVPPDMIAQALQVPRSELAGYYRAPDRLPLRAQLCAAVMLATLADAGRLASHRERSERIARALLQHVTRQIEERAAAALGALMAAGVGDVEARERFIDAHVAMGTRRDEISAALETVVTSAPRMH